MEETPLQEMSPTKRELLELERTGQYVFHGSPDNDIDEFEPRQGYTVRNGKKEPDEHKRREAEPHGKEKGLLRALLRAQLLNSFIRDRNNESFRNAQGTKPCHRNKRAASVVQMKDTFGPVI